MCCLVAFLLAPSLAGCSGGGYSHYAGRLVKQQGGEKTRPDKRITRRVVLRHPNSGEHLNLTYFEKGQYQSSAMRKIDHLFRDRRQNETYRIDPELIDFMVDIRSRLGLPPSVVFEVLSGYRSPTTNKRLRRNNKQTAKNSFHMRGWAVDFRIKGVNGKAIAEIAKTMQRGGVSYYPSSNHVHVDLGNIRTWRPK